MLKMDPFSLFMPENTEEALILLSKHGEHAKICAGGTDLLPNIKHQLHEPEFVIHLAKVKELTTIEVLSDKIRIGAMCTLQNIIEHQDIQNIFPMLVLALKAIAGPQHRRMGTVGGNICLDTRCLYYNQSYFWRESLGFCLKKDGEVCHVVKSGKKCVAAASNDGATALLALDAQIEILSQNNVKKIPLKEFYLANGTKNHILESDEMLTMVEIPRPKSLKRMSGFSKLRHRESIDFPMLSVAVNVTLDDSECILEINLVVNALAAKPKILKTTQYIGEKLTEALILEISKKAEKQCHPMTNICDDTAWRKKMVLVHVQRAFQSLS